MNFVVTAHGNATCGSGDTVWRGSNLKRSLYGWRADRLYKAPRSAGNISKPSLLASLLVYTLPMAKKTILVIGATGAQGLAVIDSLLASYTDGRPSPYAVRALTRDPTSRRAQELSKRGVECVKGMRSDSETLSHSQRSNTIAELNPLHQVPSTICQLSLAR